MLEIWRIEGARQGWRFAVVRDGHVVDFFRESFGEVWLGGADYCRVVGDGPVRTLPEDASATEQYDALAELEELGWTYQEQVDRLRKYDEDAEFDEYFANEAAHYKEVGLMDPSRPKADERDHEILAERVAVLDAIEGPRVGDYVLFADDTWRRISYIWPAFEGDEEYPPAEAGIQTSNGGSFYLGHGYVSFSGSLFTPVKLSTLTETDERRDAHVWFFHHDWMQAHNGITFTMQFRVYRCSLPASATR